MPAVLPMACTFPTSTNSPAEWLDAINLGRYKPNFENAGLTQVSQLLALTDEVLQAAGVNLIGHRKRMLQGARELAPPMPPAPAPEPVADLGARLTDMDVDDDDEDDYRRKKGPAEEKRDRSQTFGMPPMAAAAMDTAGTSAVTNAQRRANSTSSIFLSSTLTKPDTEELVFCIAVVIHERIQQGEAQPVDVRQRFPYFSEDNNPLYATPVDRDGRGSDDSGSDSSMKRTKREVPSEDTIFHTIRSVFECAQIPAECLIVSLVYMERLVAMAGCPLLVTTWRPILLSSLIVAQKVPHVGGDMRAQRPGPRHDQSVKTQSYPVIAMLGGDPMPTPHCMRLGCGQ